MSSNGGNMGDPNLEELRIAREAFSALAESVRPELLRYCARMMGSTIDGEDVVQDALARAFYELGRLDQMPALRAWLFRIAHNLAVNALVARGRRRVDGELSDDDDFVAPNALADATIERNEAVGVAIGRFLELAPSQRACVIMKDVLDLSLEDIASVLGITLPAVKSALHRGRSRLRELATCAPPSPVRTHTPELLRYVELFNGRDWEGVRAMLAREAKVDLVGRGVKDVGSYYSNYGRTNDWHLTPAWMDGREVIAVSGNRSDQRPRYVMELSIVEGTIALIRDYVHRTEVVDEATFDF